MSNEFVAQKGIISRGGITYPYVNVTATYNVLETDYLVDCTANSFSVTLPSATTIKGKIYVIKNSGLGTITLNTSSSQTIDGSLTKTINQYDSITVQSTGSNWIVLNAGSGGGSVGSSGTSGTSGGSGTSGTSGGSGTSGTSGGSGTSGTSGGSGTSGTSGGSGTSGTSGANGTSGTGFSTILNPTSGRVLIANGTVNSAEASSGITITNGQIVISGTNNNNVLDVYHVSAPGSSTLISRFRGGSPFPQLFINKTGNTSVNYHLDVNGAINTSDSGYSINNDKVKIEYLNASSSGFIAVNSGNDRLTISASSVGINSQSGGFFTVRPLGASTSAAFRVYTGSTGTAGAGDTALTVLPNRRVGIGGITDPQSTLHVIASDNSSTSSSVTVDAGTQSLFFVRNDGRVGVGTKTPNSNLHVYGTSNSLFNVSGSTGNLVEVFNETTGNLLTVGTYDNKPIFAVNSDGNIYYSVLSATIPAGGNDPTVIDQISSSSGSCAFFDYRAQSGNDKFRVGTVVCFWQGSTLSGAKDNTLLEFGSTSALTLSVTFIGNLVSLRGFSNDSVYSIKTISRVF